MGRNFNRGSDDIDLGDLAGVDFSVSDTWTAACFCRFENATVDDHALWSKWTTSTARQHITRANGGAAAPMFMEVFADASAIITGATDIDLDTWYAVMVTHDGTSSIGSTELTTIKLSDGTVVDDAVSNGSAWTDNSSFAAPIIFGNQGGSPMDGDLAFEIYIDGKITRQELLSFISRPFTMATNFIEKYGVQYFLPLGVGSPEPDWSGNGNNGTVTGATVGDNPPVSWLNRGPFVPYEVVTGNVETLAAVAVGVATVNRQLSMARTLSATATGIAAMSLALQISRTLAAVATGVATLVTTGVGQFERTLAATATGIATLTTTLSLSRALTATATGVATIITALSLSRALAATATGVATVARQLSLFKTLPATATGVATLAAGRLFEVTLSAIATVVATVTGVFSEAPEEPAVPFSGHAGISGKRTRWRLRRTKWKRRR